MRVHPARRRQHAAELGTSECPPGDVILCRALVRETSMTVTGENAMASSQEILASPHEAPGGPGQRERWADSLRVLVIAVVVVFHTATAYLRGSVRGLAALHVEAELHHVAVAPQAVRAIILCLVTDPGPSHHWIAWSGPPSAAPDHVTGNPAELPSEQSSDAPPVAVTDRCPQWLTPIFAPGSSPLAG